MKITLKKILGGVLAALVLLTSIMPMGNGILDMGMLKVYGSTDELGEWEYVILTEGTIEITSYYGNESELVIPSEIDGYSVGSIGEGAFSCCSSLTCIDLPESIRSIGDYAFYCCENLTSIDLPESIKSIEDYAFYYCENLTSVEVPSGVTSIGDYAFYYCENLTSIELPLSVTSVGASAFDGCDDMVIFCAGNAYARIYAVENGIKYITNGKCNESKEWEYVVLDNGTAQITAYHGTATELVIPLEIDGYSVSSIGKYAFCDCYLDNIEIMENITSIGEEAFGGQFSGDIYCVKDSYAYTYFMDNENDIVGHRSIRVKMGEWVYEIFGEITILEYNGNEADVVIPTEIDGDTVTRIWEYAFKDCENLTSIEIPSGVTTIFGGNTFQGCSNLSSIIVHEDNTVYDSRNNCNAIIETQSNRLIAGCKSTVIPSGVTCIEEGAFSGNTGLESITIPSGVTDIAAGAFSGCANLKKIELTYGLQQIGFGAFRGCGSLESIKIPKSVKQIGHYAFESCSNLEIITILSEVSYIGFDVFYNCDKLIIYCPLNSYANKYAIENRIKWISEKKEDTTKEPIEKPTEVPMEKPIENSVVKLAKVNSLKQKGSYSTSAITMTWKKVTGADGYEVYRATSKNGKYKKVASTTKTEYKNIKMKAGKTYYYKICAYKKVNGTKIYGAYSSAIGMNTKTSKPSVKLTAGKKQAKITWKKVSGAGGYEIYMSTSKFGKYKKVKVTGSMTTSFIKKKLTKGKTYYFKVRTYCKIKGKKVYSAWSSVKTIKLK